MIILVEGKYYLTDIMDFFNVANKYLDKCKSIADLYLRFYEALISLNTEGHDKIFYVFSGGKGRLIED